LAGSCAGKAGGALDAQTNGRKNPARAGSGPILKLEMLANPPASFGLPTFLAAARKGSPLKRFKAEKYRRC
jgi:hypothetical protein